jgi:hypothetical protein
VGLGLFAAAAFAVPWRSPLGLGTQALAILVLVAVWEWASLGAGLREAA